MKVLHSTDTDLTIDTARFPTEKELVGLGDWDKKMCLYGTSEAEDLVLITRLAEIFSKVLGRRRATHMFPGHSNNLWILTNDELTAILALENETLKAKALKEADQEAVEWIINPAYQMLTLQELNGKRRDYDRIANEGGEGYNPYRDNYYIQQPRTVVHGTGVGK